MTKHYRICRIDDIDEGEARSFLLHTPADQQQIFIVRKNDLLAAYFNRCPHTGVNLDWVPHQLLDNSGEFIQCATHGALFNIDDGLCIQGPCVNQSLETVPITLVDGWIECNL